MSAAEASAAAPTPAERLKALFGFFKRILEEILNGVFSLSSQAGEIRNLIRTLLFGLLWLYWSATLHDVETWKTLILPLRDAILTNNGQQIILQGGIFAFESIFAPEVLRNLLTLIAPYLLAREMAAVYLADIFEKETKIARKFLLQVAFGEEYSSIRISEGKIVADHQGSTIVQIGGPGYVTVDLDSAVLFERPDGSAHVIGPTAVSKEKKAPAEASAPTEKINTGDQPRNNRVVLNAFERVRQCVDLRPINDGQEVSARSLDGIWVTAKDIQYTYSIYRGAAPLPSLQNPYPFDKEAVTKMVYGPPRPVKMGGAPDTKSDWTKPMPGKIIGNVSGALGEFISQRGLTEFFSAIGRPEEETLSQRATGVQNASLSLVGESGGGEVASPLQAPASFTSRASLSEQILATLQKQLPNGGKQIHWLGIGSWVTTEKILPNSHLEAWKISQENRRLRAKDNLEKIYKDANQNELAALIRQMPLERYVALDDEVRGGSLSEPELMDELLKEYHQRLADAKQYLDEHKENPSKSLENALEILNLLRYRPLGSDYFIGYRHSAKASADVEGASIHQFDLVFASMPLGGYEIRPVVHDFMDEPLQEFHFELNASRGLLRPASLQSATMRPEDLFTQVSFELTLLPGEICDLQLNFAQGATQLGEFFLALP
ncbi:MAG: hypothetical protein Fur0035_00150 [Anaerolineales bacterium]